MKYNELISLLKTASTAEEIDIYRKEIEELIPKVKIMFDFDQQNYTHQFDLWFHSLNTVIGLPRRLPDDMLYMAALLHDIGKPETMVEGKRKNDKNMHYYKHHIKGAEIISNEIIPILLSNGVGLSRNEQERLIYYVRYHDDTVAIKYKSVKRHADRVSIEVFKKLMLLQIADAKAHIMYPFIEKRIETCEILYEEIADSFYDRIKRDKC